MLAVKTDDYISEEDYLEGEKIAKERRKRISPSR